MGWNEIESVEGTGRELTTSSGGGAYNTCTCINKCIVGNFCGTWYKILVIMVATENSETKNCNDYYF